MISLLRLRVILAVLALAAIPALPTPALVEGYQSHRSSAARVAHRVRRATEPNPDADWRLNGSCNTADPELFFDEDDRSMETRAAKMVCMSCPVLSTCTDFSMVNRVEGVWGAMTTRERRTFLPEWRRKLGFAGVAAARRRFQLETPESLVAQPSVQARSDRRLERAKSAYEKLTVLHAKGDVPNADVFRKVLEAVIANPTQKGALLAERLDHSETWFNTKFREACEAVGV